MTRPLNVLVFSVICFVVAVPASALSQRIEATYDIIWKGMLVSTAETSAELSSGSYSLSAEMRMRGLAKLFVGGDKTTFSARGLVGSDGDLQPQEYRSQGKWKGHAYQESLTYNPDGKLAGLVKDWPEKWQQENARVPVPEALQNGYDPASMFVALMRRQFPANAGTAVFEPAVYKVFDGDTVVNWSVKCAAAPVTLKKTKHSMGGEAHECVFSRELLAGHRIAAPGQKAKKQDRPRKRRSGRGRSVRAKSYDGPMKVWMGRVQNTEYWLPVKAFVPSEKGTVQMYLKDLESFASAPERLALNRSSR